LLRNGHRVVLFPTQVHMDRMAIGELKASVFEDVPLHLHHQLSDVKLRTVEECFALLSQLDLVVTSRLHGVILSFLANTPVIALSPARKIDSWMEEMELREYRLGTGRTEVSLLIDRFKKLDLNRHVVKQALRERVAEYRLAVDAQFDLVFRTRD